MISEGDSGLSEGHPFCVTSREDESLSEDDETEGGSP